MNPWLEANKKLNSILLKRSHVLHTLPWGDANFHLIKVCDVSWDTKPDKLIHKSITYYHKLLSERRLQLDPRQSKLWCSSSHSNIGYISIVTDSFSVILAVWHACFFFLRMTTARQDPTCLRGKSSWAHLRSHLSEKKKNLPTWRQKRNRF